MQKLATALVKFRAECGSVKFDSINPHFKSRFASLAAIHDTVDPLLAANGLVVLQFPINEPGHAGCVTIILHESGERIECRFLVPLAQPNPQGACAAVSYARRYGLAGALGIVTEEDDDGESSMGRAAVADAGKPKPPRSKVPAMQPGNRDRLKFAADRRIGELGDESITQKEIIQSVAKALGYASPIEMKDTDFGAALSAVQTFEPGVA